MSKPKNYFVNFKKIETGSLSRGVLVQAKCERSALFYISNKYNLKEWKLNKIIVVSDKIYNRLTHLNNLRIKREHEEWVKNGGERRLKENLVRLAAINASLGGPYGGGL